MVNRHINTSARLRFGSDRVCQVEAGLGAEVVVRPRFGSLRASPPRSRATLWQGDTRRYHVVHNQL